MEPPGWIPAVPGRPSRDELRAALADREVLLPPPVSIAHQLIQSWYGEELPGVW